MVAAINPAPIHRATILIACGNFGLACLRRFLSSTAARGVLVWEDSPEPDIKERRLRDLALLYLPNKNEDVHTETELDDSTVELMRDLYQQIETVAYSVEGTHLESAMVNSATVLLDAATRAARDSNLPLGLDVVVLVHPADRAFIGQLKPLLVNGINGLYKTMTQLQRQIPGANALNLIQIMDFENYGVQSDQGRHLREAVYSYVDFWQTRRNEDKPSFGRIYLVDGHTGDGIRDQRQRLDEISLFLEFLLFESQRDGQLQNLYQAQAMDDSIIASFGIRLIERSAGLLKRLAAAYFGIGWLDYLANTHNQVLKNETQQLRKHLSAFQEAALGETIQQSLQYLDQALEQQMLDLKEELETLPIEDPAWPLRVQNRYDSAVSRIKNELSSQAYDHVQKILSQPLFYELHKSLQQEVDQALHHDRHPLTLAAVIDEIDTILNVLQKTSSEQIGSLLPISNFINADIKALQESYQHFQLFCDQQLDVNHVRRWWVLLSLLLGIGVGPVISNSLSSLPTPSLGTFWLFAQLHPFLKSLADFPFAISLVASIIFWCLLQFLVHPGISKRNQSARQYWILSRRSRLIHKLRNLSSSDGELGMSLKTFVAQIRQGVVSTVQGEVIRELGVVKASLRDRQAEAKWLSRQLREFLILHGLDPSASQVGWNRGSHEQSGIRYALENQTDFQRILQANAPSPERFLSLQARRQPFKNWFEHYNQNLLYPLRFIDELSDEYHDPLEAEMAKPGMGEEQFQRAEELKKILRRYGECKLAFNWRAQDGMPPDRLFCLLPKIWQHLPGVSHTLEGLGIPSQNQLSGNNTTRAYLLRIQTGVKSTCLK